MIIDVCTDDQDLVWIGYQASLANREAYGKNYQVFHHHIPTLPRLENLYLLAHGAAFGDEGEPVIGSKEDALYLSARQLYRNIVELFPKDYAGSIFISACEAYMTGVNGLSFAEEFKAAIHEKFPCVKVHYQNPPVEGPLPLPDSRDWSQA